MPEPPYFQNRETEAPMMFMKGSGDGATEHNGKGGMRYPSFVWICKRRSVGMAMSRCCQRRNEERCLYLKIRRRKMRRERKSQTDVRKIDEDGDSQTKHPSRYEDEPD